MRWRDFQRFRRDLRGFDVGVARGVRGSREAATELDGGKVEKQDFVRDNRLKVWWKHYWILLEMHGIFCEGEYVERVRINRHGDS